MDTLNVALVGPGGIADRAFGPALAHVPGMQLWSVCSRSLERAAAFATRHGAASPTPAYDDLDALLADPDLHAVILATPDGLHGAEGLKVAAAGKHLLVEKPMVTSRADGEALVAACAEHDVRLGVAYHLRWHAGHRRLHHAVQQGALGELRHLRVQWTFRAASDENWRAHDAVGRWWSLAGVGTHCLNLARWFLRPTQGEVVELSSVISREVFHGPHDETAVLALRFEGGATAEVVSSVLFDATPRVELFGSQGSAVCKGTLGPHGSGQIRLSGRPFEYTPRDPYEGELADFADAIRRGRDPEVDGLEGLKNVALLLAAVGDGV